jgi:signal transduction histidine kinase/ActR/RegA family two-component response regulator
MRLTDTPATGDQQRRVLFASAALVLATAALVPIARLALPPVPAVTGVFATLSAAADLLTFALLVRTGAARRSRAIGWIASAYLFGGILALLHVATFPGAFVPGPLLPVRPDTVGWLFLVWRCGLPLLVLGGALVDRRETTEATTRFHVGRAAGCVLLGAAAAFALAAWLPLPAYLRGDSFTGSAIAASVMCAALSAAAIGVIWATRRAGKALFLWLTVVLLAYSLGLALSTYAGARFTLGWYAARVFSLAASALLLTVLLGEFVRLYRRLATTVDELAARTEELQAEIHRRASAERRLAQAQKLEAVGQLAGGLAHDFNNLLQVVSARLELVRRRGGAAFEEDVGVMRRTIRRAEGLTRQLLAVSGRRTLRPSLVRPAEVLLGARELLRTLLRNDIRLNVEAAADTGLLEVDPGELETTLVNLVANARDAMPHGGEIVLAARADRPVGEERAAGYVVLTVRDTGTGIGPDVLERVFEPFFTTKEAGRGSGLGLAQVYAFATQSGGSVSIASRPGAGTEVAIRLPRADVAGATGQTAARPARPDATWRGALVLLVEDHDDVAQSTRALLEQFGLAVHRAASADEALAWLEASPSRPRLVLSDVVMPGTRNGVELGRAIRAHFPDVPVALCTAFTASAAQALDAGFPLLRKPYEADDLLAVVAQALGESATPPLPAAAAG